MIHLALYDTAADVTLNMLYDSSIGIIQYILAYGIIKKKKKKKERNVWE
jgi:hypothetical protein